MPKKNEEKLRAAKENLARYRTFEAEREEGYEGHLEWDPDDSLLFEAMAFFYKAVKKRYYLEVRSFLGILMPHGPEDPRLLSLQRLLCNTPSEEALKEALLLAITTGSRPLVEFILQLFVDCPYLERCGAANSQNFPPHMTPLMLACITNSFAIVQCLILRGHTLQPPHILHCECSICRRQTVSTRNHTRIVDVMRAVSSEAYLFLATDDVFAATCAVAKDLQKLINEDDLEQIEIYRTLEINVQRFMARLADQAWRAEEFNIMIGEVKHCPSSAIDSASPRLQLALDAHMRQFTCSTNSQMAIKSVFRRDWYNFGSKISRDLWRLSRASFLMPFLVILHAIYPNKGTTMAIPLARYIAHLSTYILFVAAAVYRPIVSLYNDWSVDAEDRLCTWAEIFIYVYIFGLTIERMFLMHRVGTSSYFSFWWRWFDTFLIMSYVVSFVFFLNRHDKREHFDPTEVDRMHWPAGEVLLLHEISLAFACVLAISKCFYYLQLLNSIGGSIISVGKCVGKTYTYLIIMVIVIVSFSVGINVIVGPYVSRRLIESEGAKSATSDDYNTIGTSTKNLFWSIFGYLGPSTYVTVVGNTGRNMEPVNHYFNSATLEILGALYHGIIIITVLNLMTSLLVKKADEVLDNEEMEFKYTRATVYSEFVTWHMAAPPPFNIILLPAHAIHIHLLGRRIESPSWIQDTEYYYEMNRSDGDKPEERKKVDRLEEFLDMQEAVFMRFIGSKECKYRSIWRTEFDKEEKHLNHVQFMTAGPLPQPLDNTYQGWRWRNERKMRLPPLRHLNLIDGNDYAGKGNIRERPGVITEDF